MEGVNATSAPLRTAAPRRQAPPRPSFARVAEDHLDEVYRYLAHLTGRPDLAEDLASETFERALKAWSGFDPGRGTPVAWLVTIARRVALDHFRGEGRRRSREERYAASEPRAGRPPDGPAGLPADLRGALARLTRAEREVIALRVVLDLDAAQAAAVMGSSPTACTSLLHRAMTKLRREVGRDDA